MADRPECCPCDSFIPCLNPPAAGGGLCDVCVAVDESTKHTAAGDVAWAKAIYDAVMGARPALLSNLITAADLTGSNHTTDKEG